MGINGLNTFLKEKIPECIEEVYFSNFKGKKIAIDTSIYFYNDTYFVWNWYVVISPGHSISRYKTCNKFSIPVNVVLFFGFLLPHTCSNIAANNLICKFSK